MQIRAKLITYDENGRELKKPKLLSCHFAKNDNPPVIEVMLPDKTHFYQSILINPKDLLREILNEINY